MSYVHGYDGPDLEKRQPVDRPATWEVCHVCNFGGHTCTGCGDDLTHAEAKKGHDCQ